jgi:hypothetical protein
MIRHGLAFYLLAFIDKGSHFETGFHVVPTIYPLTLGPIWLPQSQTHARGVTDL